MNKNRIDFNQPKSHSINITNYWFLGFTEGEGYFYVNKNDYSLRFSVCQTVQEIAVMEAIQKFLLSLPGKLSLHQNKNPVKIATYNSAKNRNHKPMCYVWINQKDFLTNVLQPFFDDLIWFSKKQQDYKDWKLALNIINQGKHFLDEGKQLISLFAQRMNKNRLSTSRSSADLIHVDSEREALGNFPGGGGPILENLIISKQEH